MEKSIEKHFKKTKRKISREDFELKECKTWRTNRYQIEEREVLGNLLKNKALFVAKNRNSTL